MCSYVRPENQKDTLRFASRWKCKLYAFKLISGKIINESIGQGLSERLSQFYRIRNIVHYHKILSLKDVKVSTNRYLSIEALWIGR